ncbi:MAG: DUF2780 domain-containing protein [Candidatus Thiodiazotropha sp. (ex Dulcina madagascariensis)]|nr:DUF2780 domain-containing protein [Candidatus Thiodiazotropha sp. (ex Dulcina madagascariensis)]
MRHYTKLSGTMPQPYRLRDVRLCPREAAGAGFTPYLSPRAETAQSADTAGGFNMIGKFVPIVLGFLQNQGGEGLATLVGKVLQGD